ncbi:KGK domain-containing protein [Anabaena azotica]|uniref:KGK family protein n=1 Tax=Anabaena azotica FACHB-119 TaxID=947527 RepID=A0ABR8DAN3_9NOST|nr:KGK domain-containing protein [Anabaena azotica]MBD2504001.1 KGK family protein [Anabaena azotica FACHB-119]
MKNQFIPLDCGEDVVLLDKDTFTVTRLREVILRQIISKWRQEICVNKTSFTNGSVGSLFHSISTGDSLIPFNEIRLNAVKECQLLKVGGKGWQKGKLNIRLFIYPNSDKINHLNLEFYPDKSIETVSHKDDTHQNIR